MSIDGAQFFLVWTKELYGFLIIIFLLQYRLLITAHAGSEGHRAILEE
jgi:hypothetical protein